MDGKERQRLLNREYADKATQTGLFMLAGAAFSVALGLELWDNELDMWGHIENGIEFPETSPEEMSWGHLGGGASYATSGALSFFGTIYLLQGASIRKREDK